MIENLIYSIILSVNLAVIILESFVLRESVKKKNLGETIYWLAFLFASIFLTVNCPLFSWSIYNFIGG